MFQFAKF
ncbi:unnamed protein product [Linum tenue]|nr:unnamed protein product [Linum tenue]